MKNVIIKKLLFMKLLLIWVLFGLFSNEPININKLRIAILPFLIRGDVDKTLSELLSENFTISMIETGQYVVVERTQLDKALKELKFQKGDEFDDASAVEVGKLAGAQVVVIGTITNIDEDYFISARGIDVKTGVALFARKEQTENKKDIINIIDKIANTISINNNSNGYKTAVIYINNISINFEIIENKKQVILDYLNSIQKDKNFIYCIGYSYDSFKEAYIDGLIKFRNSIDNSLSNNININKNQIKLIISNNFDNEKKEFLLKIICNEENEKNKGYVFEINNKTIENDGKKLKESSLKYVEIIKEAWNKKDFNFREMIKSLSNTITIEKYVINNEGEIFLLLKIDTNKVKFSKD